MSLPPVTEEDNPAVASMIKKLKRLRKREAALESLNKSSCNHCSDQLTKAIDELIFYGQLKEWWNSKGEEK